MNSKAQLYQKMLAVMEAIDYLQKDDTVAFGNTKYQAISEEKVTMTVRAELIKNKLIVFPIEQEHTREGALTTVNVKYKIVDTETGESEILVSSGTGADTQDKGVGKAMTYAFKYLFLRTFAIPTGEDPDKISSAELDDKQKKEAERKAKAEQKGNDDLAEIERESKLNAVLAKWKVLSGEMDNTKATAGFNNYLKQYKTTVEKVPLDTLITIEELLAKKLVEKQGQKGGVRSA